MPRPAPPAIPFAASTRWPTPDAYWAEPWSAADAQQALEKYRAMSKALAAGPTKSELRAIAARWPGALREAQVTDPAVYARRADVLANSPARIDARGVWARQGLAAIPLWADLHGLIADVGRMRTQGGDLFAALGPARRPSWPDAPSSWPPWVLRRLEPRVAIAWLAAVAELDPAMLELELRR